MYDLKKCKNERVQIAENAIVFPFMQALPKKSEAQKLRWSHGVETLEDIPDIYLDQYREGVSTIDHSERTKLLQRKKNNGFSPKDIKGNWMYGGILYDHFGHFLSESVHRLWFWIHCSDKVDGIIFLTSGPETLEDFANYYLELFDLWGIDEDKIKLVTEISTVETLHLPLPGGTIGAAQPEWYEDELKRLTPSNIFLNSAYPEKVIFSRQKFLHSGKIIGFEAIESVLVESGYVVVYPEDCSLKEQLGYIVNATEVVWEEGSNIHVLDILPRQNLLAYIFKRRRGLKTFDVVLNRKVTQLRIFDLTKKLSYPHASISEDIDGRRLAARVVSRLSLSVISRIHNLRTFLVKQLGIVSLQDVEVFDRFIYDLFLHESQDIQTFVNIKSSNQKAISQSELLHHLMTQYVYVRTLDSDLSKVLRRSALTRRIA